MGDQQHPECDRWVIHAATWAREHWPEKYDTMLIMEIGHYVRDGKICRECEVDYIRGIEAKVRLIEKAKEPPGPLDRLIKPSKDAEIRQFFRDEFERG